MTQYDVIYRRAPAVGTAAERLTIWLEDLEAEDTYEARRLALEGMKNLGFPVSLDDGWRGLVQRGQDANWHVLETPRGATSEQCYRRLLSVLNAAERAVADEDQLEASEQIDEARDMVLAILTSVQKDRQEASCTS